MILATATVFIVAIVAVKSPPPDNNCKEFDFVANLLASSTPPPLALDKPPVYDAVSLRLLILLL